MSEATGVNDFIAIMRGRAAFYEFFSLSYRKPADEGFLGIIKQFLPHFQALAKEITIGEIITGAENLAEFVNEKVNKAEKPEETEDLLNLMNCCYTSLFLLGHSSVATSESVYLSPEKLLKQAPWEEVVKIYQQHQFVIPPSFKESEDHISMETLFMYFLAENTAKAFESGDEERAETLVFAQKDFLYDHILRWAPEFCDIVLSKNGKDTIFLDAATMLLKGFLIYDKDFLQELTAE